MCFKNSLPTPNHQTRPRAIQSKSWKTEPLKKSLIKSGCISLILKKKTNLHRKTSIKKLLERCQAVFLYIYSFADSADSISPSKMYCPRYGFFTSGYILIKLCINVVILGISRPLSFSISFWSSELLIAALWRFNVLIAASRSLAAFDPGLAVPLLLRVVPSGIPAGREEIDWSWGWTDCCCDCGW